MRLHPRNQDQEYRRENRTVSSESINNYLQNMFSASSQVLICTLLLLHLEFCRCRIVWNGMEGLSIARKLNPIVLDTLLLFYTTHDTQPHPWPPHSLVLPSTTPFLSLFTFYHTLTISHSLPSFNTIYHPSTFPLPQKVNALNYKVAFLDYYEFGGLKLSIFVKNIQNSELLINSALWKHSMDF